MREIYESPALELLCLAAEEHLATSLDFDALLEGGGNGVSANPDIDIDVPLL